ncbi:unnamed protein product [Urochloa humidicola]
MGSVLNPPSSGSYGGDSFGSQGEGFNDSSGTGGNNCCHGDIQNDAPSDDGESLMHEVPSTNLPTLNHDAPSSTLEQRDNQFYTTFS